MRAVFLSLAISFAFSPILLHTIVSYRSTTNSLNPYSPDQFPIEKFGNSDKPEDGMLKSKIEIKNTLSTAVPGLTSASTNENFGIKVKKLIEVKKELKEEQDLASPTTKSTTFLESRHGATSLPHPTDWSSRSFCHQFLVKTFQKSIPVCTNDRSSAVQCFGSPFSNRMGTCILENVVVYPHYLARAMQDTDIPKFKQSEPSIALLSDRGSKCHNMTVTYLQKHVESSDYVWHIINKMKQEKPKTSHVCDSWIEEDVFFFTANKVHIYFRFLDYFNLHKVIVDFKNYISSSVPRIIRISGSYGYHFAEFDQKLFPEVNFGTLDNLGNGSVCFKRVILVPRSYASVLFRCKMHSNLRRMCGDCNGWELSKTQILPFRDRVLRACSLNDSIKLDANSSIVFISRKPYFRFKNDGVNRFERVMDNEDNLTAQLRKTFKSFTVQKVNLEDLGICEQVGLAHNADIYLGVHGSGLVHLWWLKEDAMVYELEPHYEKGNPTFWMLARLSCRKYMKSFIAGGQSGVHANINQIIAKLKEVISKSKDFDLIHM